MTEEFSLKDLGLPEGVQQDLVGQTLSGCHVERLLGRGGMGAVYLARRLSDGFPLVVKVLAAEVALNPKLRARFQREWAALKKIHPPHPNVVQVYDVLGEGDQPHILMEYVEGVPLLRPLQEHGRLNPEHAARVALDVARGLAVVHGLGMIHRDVKPANLLLTPSGQAKIVDFGVAKDVFMTSLTQPGQLLGTAYYMAPEQWGEEATVDARADIFALGATLYHLLVGRPPFVGEDVHETGDLIQSGEFEPPTALVPGIPAELELLVFRMLIPDLRFRYPTMEEVAEDLERVLAGQPCRIPCLSGQGLRLPLLPLRRFTLGSDPKCQLHIDHPSLKGRHAQIRREADGFTIRDLKSPTGTFVQGERLARARTLQDGDQVRLGEVELVFHDPGATRRETVSFLLDVQREEHPDPIVRGLRSLGDQRTALDLLERLAPDPWGDQRGFQMLATLLGEQTARSAGTWKRQEEDRIRPHLPAQLAKTTGASVGTTPGAWLAWWAQVRASAPPQVTSSGLLRRSCRLRVGEQRVALDQQGIVLVGRDPRCSLRVEGAARLHVTVLRLHHRFVVRDEGHGSLLNGAPLQSAVAFFEPGDTLACGGAQLVLEVDPTPPQLAQVSMGLFLLDPDWFRALEAIRHPSVAVALVGLLHEPHQAEWIPRHGSALFPGDPTRAGQLTRGVQGQYAERLTLARQLLPHLLGADAGADLAAWSQLLAQRRSQLPPQVAPAGWLATTRTA